MPAPSTLTAIAIAFPWFAALLVMAVRRQPRIWGFCAALVSVAASALAARSAPSLYGGLMLLFSCLTLAATLILARRDCTPAAIAGILFLLGSTLLAYSAENLLVLLAAWILSAVPFLLPRWFRAQSWRPSAALVISSAALALALALIVSGRGIDGLNLASLKGRNPGGVAAFALLVIAVIFRKGICPAHAWVGDALESGPVVPTALLLNGHFGALLVAKAIVPLFSQTAGRMFPVLSYLAVATALYVAIRAVTENSPRACSLISR